MKIFFQYSVSSSLRSHHSSFNVTSGFDRNYNCSILTVPCRQRAAVYFYFSWTHREFCFVSTSHYSPSLTWLQTSNYVSTIQLLFHWAAFLSYTYAYILNSWNQQKAQLMILKFSIENVFAFPQFKITLKKKKKKRQGTAHKTLHAPSKTKWNILG